jgi:hypothetical protein
MRLTRRKTMSKQKSKAVSDGPIAQSGNVEAEQVVPAWALGQTAVDYEMSERERKLTAAMYSQLPGVVEHVRRTGRLPPKMASAGGIEIGLRLLVERRGIDLELSEDERMVLDAIALSGEVPVGCAALLDPRMFGAATGRRG